ncbi:hypothetical protein HNQ79_006218, partial [Streptomyces candidus]|nr:hypothetical protein [Streptomyces candidus]
MPRRRPGPARLSLSPALDRFAHARLGHLFRYLPQQSAYNKRLNAAGPLI